MRVLAVTNLCPPHHVGGCEIPGRAVTERLHEAGHDVLVLTSRLEQRLAGGAGRATSDVGPSPVRTGR